MLDDAGVEVCVAVVDGLVDSSLTGAVVLERHDEPTLLSFDLGAEGKLVHTGYTDHAGFITMDGKEIFRNAVRAVTKSATRALEKADMTAADIDWFIPHQANVRIIEAIANRLEIPMEQTVVTIGDTANNSAATIPMALGWIRLITRWNRSPETWLHRRVRAVGRMALTNYLTQTMLGLGLVALLGDDLGRVQLLGLVVLIWTLQLVWSQPWLERFTMGPFEWLWRVLTYRRIQPIRRPA